MFFSFDWQVVLIIAYLEDFFSPVNLFSTPPLWRGFRLQKVKSSNILLLFYNALKNPYGKRPYAVFFALVFIKAFTDGFGGSDEIQNQ